MLLRLKDVIPDEANIPFMLGQVYRKLGKSAEAARHMSIALDIDPRLSSAMRSVQANGRVVLDGLLPPSASNQTMDTDAG